MLVFPNAKINLGLNVIEPRTDGFHNISSCFYPIEWHDVIEIVESDKFSFEISGIDIPGNQNDNLCVKAYRLLKKDFQLPEVSIQLHKIIPVGAGLGGGSSDASYVLKVINTLFNLFLSDEILEVYAEQLGSDCPFFIGNKSVIAESKGEELKPIHIDLNNYQIAIIHPGLMIDTATAYKNIRSSQPKISVRKIIELLEHAFREKGAGRVEMPPKPGIHPGGGDNFIHAMPAYIPGMNSAGIKWVGGFPENNQRGLPYISGLLILNDPETGLPFSGHSLRSASIRIVLSMDMSCSCAAVPRPS